MLAIPVPYISALLLSLIAILLVQQRGDVRTTLFLAISACMSLVVGLCWSFPHPYPACCGACFQRAGACGLAVFLSPAARRFFFAQGGGAVAVSGYGIDIGFAFGRCALLGLGRGFAGCALCWLWGRFAGVGLE